MEKNNFEVEKSIIDLGIIVGVLKKYWWILVATTLLMTGVAILDFISDSDSDFDATTLVESYRASTIIYVGLQGEQSAVDDSVILMQSQIMQDYVDDVLLENQMVSLMDGDDKIVCKRTADANYITLQVTGTSFRREEFIINLMANEFIELAKDVLKLEDCRVINDITVTPILPVIQKKEFSYIFPAFGALIGCAILALIMLFSDKIWSFYDLKCHFNEKFWGCYSQNNHDWVSIIKHQCRKHGYQYLYISDDGAEADSEEIYAELQSESEWKLISLEEFDKKHEPSNVAVLFIIRKGKSSYKNLNQTLIRIKGLDIEVAGCVYIR